MRFQNLRALFPCAVLLAVFFATGSQGVAEFAANRYALILEDPPVSARFRSAQKVRSAEAGSYRRQIQARQDALRNELRSRDIVVTGSVTTLLNALFVVAPQSRLAELKSLSGVKAVVPLRRYRRDLNRAAPLVNAPAAWNVFGGVQNAGSGVKVAILDSGIDQTHPAFQDSSLPMPPGYPMCSGSDCEFTNNKVIAARSYVRQLAAGSPPNPAADSRPDDYSPRDRDGHGTAVASCVAGVANGGTVTFTGIAPKAYLGNYKIYGSPEVNDSTTDAAIIMALEDAWNDGMDVVNFSSGGPALTGPLDTGAICGNPPGVACDLSAQAFENAAASGLVIVASAGNSGQDGQFYPTFNSIGSPGDAPSVIAVGATTNSHTFLETVSVTGPGVPPNLSAIQTRAGDAYVPRGSVTAPLRDVTQFGNDGLACSPLPAGSLFGAFALILRGTCTFAVKAANAQAAGAAGVIFYMADDSPIIGLLGLSSFAIPAVMISNSDGLALKNFIAANPEHPVLIDGAGMEQDSASYDLLAGFSSLGPAAGSLGIKPDLAAVGTNLYFAGERYDPLGALYSSNGYATASGTSFAAPVVSGAAALVKQNRPGFTAAQLKSALVNTASQDVTLDQSGNPAGVQSLGGGKLDAGAAVNTALTAVPATLSFGALRSGSLPATQQLQITNSSPGAVTLSLAVVPANQSSAAAITLDKQSLTLGPNSSDTVKVTLSGSLPQPGSYSGAVTIQGSGASLRVPYLFLVGSGVPANIIPLTGANFDGTVGQPIPQGIISFKLVDAYGVPVSGVPVSFTPRNGGRIAYADSATDANGVAAAQPVLGSQPGNYSFTVAAGGLRYTASGYARMQPTISPGGVINAAAADAGTPVAPGSYISIFGAGLSDTTNQATAAILPLAIDYVNVSFDVPSAHISVPGRLTYVSPNQVNVQVPWELQGQTTAQVKVTIDYSPGNVVLVPLSDYAPAFFETGAGVVAALDSGYRVIGSGNPARRGQVVQLYANGLGPVTNQPASGDPAPSSPLSWTTTKPVVTIGGQQADLSFWGLAPGFAGLYQINATVPAGLAPGNQPITVAIGGRTSKASGIWVQ